MKKIVEVSSAAAHVRDGMSVMIGGFVGCGNPHQLVQALVETGVKDLTLICNDAPTPRYGVAKLVEHKRLRRLVASHVGLNPTVATLVNAGGLEVELVPQGTLVERIRASGAGLGGVLTPPASARRSPRASPCSRCKASSTSSRSRCAPTSPWCVAPRSTSFEWRLTDQYDQDIIELLFEHLGGWRWTQAW